MTSPHPYVGYYAPVIAAHKTGIKLVHGGTGLGKTSGIADTVKQDHTTRKFIYCANRVQLLNEMAERLRRNATPYVHLENDTDMLYAVLKGTERESLYAFLDLAVVSKYGRSVAPTGDVQSVITMCKDLETHLKLQERSAFLRDFLGNQARNIISFIKRVLIEANAKRSADHQVLLRHPLVRLLFPYSVFHTDPTCRVLLVTIQKAFYGFFDGKQHVSISTLTGDHGGYVIFLDEFDFLEHTLTELICRDGQIDAPLKFVEYFYRAMKQHKLPAEDYLQDTPLRNRIEALVATVDNLVQQGLNYPHINQFTCMLPEIKTISVFETTRTILTNDVYLCPTARSFHLVAHLEPGTLTTAVDLFFHTIHHTTSEIVRLLKEIEALDPVLYRELVQQCFDTTVFKYQLDTIRQPPRVPRVQRTRFDTLLDRGYSVYDLNPLQHTSDMQVVELHSYSMYTTPEKVLLNLATDNLVFGLSATADIPRIVRGFSDDWLQRQEGMTYHPFTPNDQAIIQGLNGHKQAERGNRIHVEHAQELDSNNPLHHAFIRFIKGIADDDGFGGNDKRGYRRRRVERFFATLLWIADHDATCDPDTHLLFFNSYRQIKYIFTDHPHSEDGLFTVTPREHDRVFQEYEIKVGDHTYSILFYDAEQGQRIKTDPTIHDQYQQLFRRHQPVLIVTTYPSAGNGINLQYQCATGEEQDMQHVHLLDSPYFYFGQPDPMRPQQERTAVIKENIWYLAKLFEDKVISEQEFKAHLSSVRSAGLNNRYHNDQATHMDSTLNQLATFIQAIGRVERVWRAMPDQTVRLSREVFAVFELFSTREIYAPLREQRAPLLSNNLQQVFDQVAQQSSYTVKQMRRLADERLQAQNSQCTERLNRLMEQFGALRRGQAGHDVRTTWLHLRQAVLAHDIHSPILREYACWLSTEYIDDGQVAIDWDTLTLYPKGIWHSAVDLWDLNSAYDVVAQNHIIRQYFERQGYELAFRSTSKKLLTPYCYQAILLGAIGEEASKAILQHFGIQLDPLPDTLFEIVDLKLTGLPWYIDCKNYGERTLEDFSLTHDDPGWRPKLNDDDFRYLAHRKLRTIQAVAADGGQDCKLLYINLVGDHDRGNQYFDAAFTPVATLESATIIVIQGIVSYEHPDLINPGMQHLIRTIQMSRA